MRRTLPAEITGEDALTLYLAIAVQPSLNPDELNESIPRLRHLASLMMSRRVAAPADVDSAGDATTTRLTTIRPTADPRIDPPTVRLAAVEPAPVMVTAPKPVTDAQADEIRAALERGPGTHAVPGGEVTVPQPKSGPRHAAAPTAPAAPLAPIRPRKEPAMRKALRVVAGLAVLAVLLVGCLTIAATGPTPPSPSSTVPAGPVLLEPEAPAVDEQAADGSLAGDGTYIVGSDVVAGVYRSTGAAYDGGMCYWARLNSTDGDIESVITSDAGKGSQVVTVKPTDRAFKSAGCATWTKSK